MTTTSRYETIGTSCNSKYLDIYILHPLQATVQEKEGGCPPTPSVATDENRILFRGNLYICKLTIVVNSHEGRRVFRHFVPRDYKVKKVVVDHHKKFGLDRMVMVYSVRPWKAAEDSGIREIHALPENTFSELINELGTADPKSSDGMGDVPTLNPDVSGGVPFAELDQASEQQEGSFEAGVTVVYRLGVSATVGASFLNGIVEIGVELKLIFIE